ncbi:MAG: hypothetical protein JNL82_10015 [Myxococcales bacterium]|nr:hypothetical protein [Myxococcales bacterium]
MSKAWLAVVSLCVACPGGAGAPRSDAKAEAKAAGGAAKVEAKAPASAPAAAGEDWLVWWFKDGGWTTRWLRVEGEAATAVGEKKALIVGDGAGMWQVERADGRQRVMGCECEQDPKSAQCEDRGHMPSLGLRARPLGGIEAVAIREAASGTVHGDDIWYGLSIGGGVQARLLVEDAASGFFCGAHGMTESRTSVFDVAGGRAVERPFAGDWWRALPVDLRRRAAEAIKGPLNECEAGDDPEATTEQVMDEVMKLASASLSLVGGEPTIAWSFTADLPYVCSPDYAAHGDARSGLIPEAAPLGLAGPLPAPVLKDIRPIGDALAFGFSRLTLADREEAAAAFSRVEEAPWPKEEASNGDVAPASPALGKLEEGRKLSRAGDLQRAIAAFDAAIVQDAGQAAAWAERGYARLRAGDYAGARSDSEKALGLEARPSFQAAVWFNLGQIAEAVGKPEEARAAYSKSQALRETRQVKAALEALGNK